MSCIATEILGFFEGIGQGLPITAFLHHYNMGLDSNISRTGMQNSLVSSMQKYFAHAELLQKFILVIVNSCLIYFLHSGICGVGKVTKETLLMTN